MQETLVEGLVTMSTSHEIDLTSNLAGLAEEQLREAANILSQFMKNPKPDPKPVSAEVLRWYQERQNPTRWLMAAQSLARAAEILFDWIESTQRDGEPINEEDVQLGLNHPATLLLGFAVENTVKAYLLQKGIVCWAGLEKFKAKKKNELTQDVQKNCAIFGTHDLVKLFKLARIQTSEDQSQLLVELSVFTTWAGRYPLNFDPAKFAQTTDSGDELPPCSPANWEREKIVQLCKKLEAELEG